MIVFRGDEPPDHWERQLRKLERMEWERLAAMTLGDALEHLKAVREHPWACACVGPPNCCIRTLHQSQWLQRDAHILVKMIKEVADRG
jgi:hypothetical protein